jgi:hypothetical protein
MLDTLNIMDQEMQHLVFLSGQESPFPDTIGESFLEFAEE